MFTNIIDTSDLSIPTILSFEDKHVIKFKNLPFLYSLPENGGASLYSAALMKVCIYQFSREH